MSITVDLTCFSFSCSDLNKQQRENINFTNKIRLPPSVLNTLMNDNGENSLEFPLFFSVKNKLLSGSDDISFLGDENEWLALYAKRKLEQKHYDYFIFGHRHLPMEIKLNEKATYVNLGDWITHFTYGMFDGQKVVLKKWETS